MDYGYSNSDASKLRRTRSLAVRYTRGDDDDNSSVSSLGSLPEADFVAQQFAPPRLTRQRTIGSERQHIRKQKVREGRKIATERGPGQHHCPHCPKLFRNSWAVPKHVSRIHDRAGELHCPKCSFKSRSEGWLSQHEKDAHRRCPYCHQLFVLLNKHVPTCPKRRR